MPQQRRFGINAPSCCRGNSIIVMCCNCGVAFRHVQPRAEWLHRRSLPGSGRRCAPAAPFQHQRTRRQLQRAATAVWPSGTCNLERSGSIVGRCLVRVGVVPQQRRCNLLASCPSASTTPSASRTGVGARHGRVRWLADPRRCLGVHL